MEDFVRIGYYLALYGECLTPRQRHLMDLHYHQDLSLAEIAQQESISRQAVMDALHRGAQVLDNLENQLGLGQKTLDLRKVIKDCVDTLQSHELPQNLRQELLGSLDKMTQLWEEYHGV